MKSGLIGLVFLFAGSITSYAQLGGGRLEWMNRKLKERAPRLAAAAEAGDSKSHAATPSLDSGGPSIVDRSNPTEFVNLALALASNRGNSASGIPTGTVTTTLYGLLAAIQRKSLIDADFYRQQRLLRRVSFTIGTAASDLAKDGTSTDSALYGFRVNILDGTDIYANRRGGPSIAEQAITQLKLANADALLMTMMTEIFDRNETERDIKLLSDKRNKLFESADSTEEWFSKLPPADQKLIEDQLKRVATQDAALTSFVASIRKQLEKPRQLSIAYFTNQRTDGGADDHRAELIFDWGFDKRLNWTVNGGFEYRNDYMHIGRDRKGGRFATEFQYKIYELSHLGDTVDRWVTFDFGGEWKAATAARPYYRGQAKLEIPILEGISFPLVWSYESRLDSLGTTQLAGGPAQKKFRFGIAFDPGKLRALSQ